VILYLKQQQKGDLVAATALNPGEEMQLVRQCLHVKSARIINFYIQSYFSPARVWI
jgi:hypothetical protein